MDEALAEMSLIAKADVNYQKIVTTLRSGLYDGAKAKNLSKLHLAQQYRSQAVDDVFLTHHNRPVVPEAARQQVSSTLHVQHTGVMKTTADARQLYF